MTVEATRDTLEHDFWSQERQHDKSGPPGISYVQNRVEVARVEHKPTGQTISVPSQEPVDCLLYRSRKGTIIGILYHYPVDLMPWEQAGNVNMWVHPRRLRRGIGTALLREAMRRWDIDPEQQSYTPEGAALMNSVLEAT